MLWLQIPLLLIGSYYDWNDSPGQKLNTFYYINLITVPFRLDNKEGVTNLQAALFFLLSKQSLTIATDELKALRNQWHEE